MSTKIAMPIFFSYKQLFPKSRKLLLISGSLVHSKPITLKGSMLSDVIDDKLSWLMQKRNYRITLEFSLGRDKNKWGK